MQKHQNRDVLAQTCYAAVILYGSSPADALVSADDGAVVLSEPGGVAAVQGEEVVVGLDQ